MSSSSDDVLKSNFKVKNPVTLDDVKKDSTEKNHETIAKELKKRALGTLGGSMVYVDRDHLTWDGSDDKQS